MSLNSGGQSFNYKFGGDDAGLGKATNTAIKGFDAVTAGVEKLVSVSTGFVLSKLFQMPKVSEFATGITALASDMHVTSTEIETNYVAASKVTSKALAGMNLTNEELRKAKSEVAGIALAMKVGAEGLAKNMAILKKAGVDVKQLGFKNFAEYSKFAEIADVDTAKLAAGTVFLGKTFKMSQKEVGDLVNRGYSIGKAFGLGKESINTMSDAIDILSNEAASLLSTMSPEDAKKFILGVEGVSAAFLKMGASAADAKTLALELGKGLTKERTGFNKMFTGLQKDIPEMATVLSQAFGNVDTAFELVQKDPAEFARLMSKAYGIAAAQGGDALSRFNNQAVEAFGPKFLTLIQNGADSLEKVKTVSDDLASGKTKISLASELSKAFEDGRSAAERFDLEKQKFAQKLKDINVGMIESDETFIKKYSASVDIMTDKIKELASDDGIIGDLTGVMMNFANHGIGGVLAEMTPFGPALATVIEKFGGILTQLPGLIKLFGLLASPITIAAAAIAGLYFYMKDAAAGGGKFKSMVDSAWVSVKGFAKDAYVAIKQFVKSIPWQDVGAAIKEGLVMALDALISIAIPLGNAIKNWFVSVKWGDVASTFVEYLGKAILAAAWVTTLLIDSMAKIDWGAVGAKAFDLAKELVGFLGLGFLLLVTRIPSIFWMAMRVAGGMLMEAWHNFADSPLTTAITTLGALLAAIFAGDAIISAITKFGARAVAAVSGSTILGSISKFGTALKFAWTGGFRTAKDGSIEFVESFITRLKSLGPTIASAASGFGSFITSASLGMPVLATVGLTLGSMAVAAGAIYVAFKAIEPYLNDAGGFFHNLAVGAGFATEKISGLNEAEQELHDKGYYELAAEEHNKRTEREYQYMTKTKAAREGLNDAIQMLRNQEIQREVESVQKMLDARTALVDGQARLNAQLKKDHDAWLIDWLRTNKTVADAEIALNKQTAKAVKMWEDQQGKKEDVTTTQTFQTIAGMSPEQFKIDLDSITKDYNVFLGNLVKNTGVLLATTKKNFGAYIEENKALWPALDAIVSQFQFNLKSAVDRYWNSVFALTRANINLLKTTVSGLNKDLSAAATKTNILDAITSDQQIMSWAVRIVSGLTTALIGPNNPFTKAIGQASGLAAALKANPEALTMNPNNPASSVAVAEGTNMFETLNTSINTPQWVDRVIEAIYKSNGKTPEPSSETGHSEMGKTSQ